MLAELFYERSKTCSKLTARDKSEVAGGASTKNVTIVRDYCPTLTDDQAHLRLVFCTWRVHNGKPKPDLVKENYLMGHDHLQQEETSLILIWRQITSVYFLRYDTYHNLLWGCWPYSALWLVSKSGSLHQSLILNTTYGRESDAMSRGAEHENEKGSWCYLF
jgi:hypothetical protein